MVKNDKDVFGCLYRFCFLVQSCAATRKNARGKEKIQDLQKGGPIDRNFAIKIKLLFAQK